MEETPSTPGPSFIDYDEAMRVAREVAIRNEELLRRLA